MQAEIFRGATLQEAIDAVRNRWGSDAVILNFEKRNDSKPVMGRSKEWIEVMAKPPTVLAPQTITSAPVPPPEVVSDELNALREEIQGFSTAVRQIERINWAKTQLQSKSTQHPLVSFMIEKGMDSVAALELFADWNMVDQKLNLKKCAQDLDQKLPRLGWDDLFPTKQGRCTLLMGLPGSGKTLLLLKIAARLRLGQQAKVLLVSADMTRPGPSQELSLYSEILKIPVQQIFDLDELQQISRENSSDTHILVDWKGISPYALQSWQPLEMLKRYHRYPQILLTASLASDLRNWQQLRSQFSVLPLVGLALTQADLEHRLGKIWEAVRGTKLPLAFLSTGKNVPGDFYEGDTFPFGQYFFRGYDASHSLKE
jgi:flagellar biosynthesis GTPase FlhF